MPAELFTIGHSTHAVEHFVGLLQQHGVNVVCDVRSQPHSRRNPQYNRAAIAGALKKQGIKYLFLGKELGARSDNPDYYDVDGRVQFKKLAADPRFRQGLDRLRRGAQKKYAIALMCAEMDPITCHRMILVARQLRSEFSIKHIREHGAIETHEQAEARLQKLLQIEPKQSELGWDDKVTPIDRAYAQQEAKIAYVRGPA